MVACAQGHEERRSWSPRTALVGTFSSHPKRARVWLTIVALTCGAERRQVQRPVSRRALRAGLRLSCKRRAALTAFDVLNASATSGAKTTTLVPRAKRAAYFP